VLLLAIIPNTFQLSCASCYTHWAHLFFFQIAISTDDVYKTAEVVRLNGGHITCESGPLPGINTKITACTDPDGWKTVSANFFVFFSSLLMDWTGLKKYLS
jgi:hypothetical protein